MNVGLSRAVRWLLGFAVLLGAATSAYANGNTINLGPNNVWTVYAFGNAQAVADAFRALTNFSASGTFQSIVGMIAVLGVLGVGMSGGFNPAMAKRFIGYVVAVFLVCYVLFGVSNNGPLVVNVEVTDTVDMTWKAPVTVPAVVGIPASIISSAGYQITQAIEASFQLPTELKMSQGAPFNLAASMIADASQARITDPNLASSLAYYVQDCFTIGVAQGALRADTLISSTDFLNDIKFDSKTVMVNTLLQPPVGTPGIVTCSDAWNYINAAVNAQGSTASDFLKDASAWSKTPAMSVVNAAADSTAQWATNSGITDGAALVKQSAILSAFRGAYAQASAQTGNSDFLTGIAMAQATESQRASWITGAELFNKTMGYIFAILQVFVYAITPLVLCASLVPGLGLALLKNFSQILLWLAIWQPMLSIVNFIVLSMQQSELGGILSNGASGYGFTLTNMGIISEKTSTLRAAASLVGTMVPGLAWAMVKGSVDFSRVIGSAVGENFAQGAANTMTTGNYSLNQASMDSFTANKHSTAATGAWGEGHTNASTVGSRAFDLGGSKLPSVGEQQMGVGSSAGVGTNHGGSTGTSAQAGRQASNMDSATSSAGTSRGTSNVQSTGNTESSALITSNTASMGGNSSFSAIKPGSGPANNGQTITGTNVPVAAGGNGQAAPGGATPGNIGKAPGGGGRLRADLSAGDTASRTGQHSDVDNRSNTNSNSASATSSQMGSKTQSGGESASHSRNAGTNDGWVENQNMQVTGISPEMARARAAAAYMSQHSGWLTSGLGYESARKSEIGDTVQKLNTDGAIQRDVHSEKAKTNSEKDALMAKEAALEGQAVAKKHQFEGGAQSEMAKGGAAVKAGEAAAHVSALERTSPEAAKVLHKAGDMANSLKNKVEDLLGHGKDSAAPQGKGASATPGSQKEQGQGHQPSVAPAHQVPQAPQAQANPPLAAADVPPTLAQANAQAQQHLPDSQGQHAAPNPFSGEKVAEASGQLQGQVQMAEQRAERLDNQRKAVDGVLASAEGRKADELPELINQARDLTRNT